MVLAFAFFTNPILVLFHDGNNEGLLVLMLMGMLALLQRSRYMSAAIVLGVATAIKGIPGIFFILFVRRRLWKPLFAGLAIAGALNGLALLTFKDPVNISLMKWEYEALVLRQFWAWGPDLTDCGISLFGPVRNIALSLAKLTSEDLRTFETLYIFFGAAALYAVCWYVVVKKGLQLWQEMFLLVGAMIVFPTVSGDYKALDFLIPTMLFLKRTDVRWNGLWKLSDRAWCWILLALLALVLGCLPSQKFRVYSTWCFMLAIMWISAAAKTATQEEPAWQPAPSPSKLDPNEPPCVPNPEP